MRLLPERLAIYKLPPDASLPTPPATAGVWSLTITSRERSLLCGEADVPAGAEVDAGGVPSIWKAPCPFDLAGVLLSAIAPISSNGLGVFALSTFDGDLVLVRDAVLDTAIAHLRDAGHDVVLAV